jgi:ATP-dependent RNA helicase RhlE
MSEFKSFNLLPSILEQVAKIGYQTPTPIQQQSIPYLIDGADLLGIAQTGSGKTAAFSLPILNRLAKNKVNTSAGRIRALILTPTRELASQIEVNIKLYGEGLGLESAVVFGGVSKQVQVDTLDVGVDILVATPGRLLDLVRGSYVKFDQLEVFVLDEADSMLDLGFFADVELIISNLPGRKQTLLFSATMPGAIEALAKSLLRNPVKVQVAPEATPVETVEQKIFFIDKANRVFALLSILEDESVKSVLVFCKTKFGADRVVEHLERVPISVATIHSQKTQAVREKALSDFRGGQIRVLVATDIAARGIDVSHVTHVINLNLPEDPKNYIHRIGRTARAGRQGVAISFCVESEVPLLNNVEKMLKAKIPVDVDQPFHKDFSLTSPKTALTKKKKSKSKKGRR